MNQLNERLRVITKQLAIYNKELKETNHPQEQWDLSRKITELEVERDKILKDIGD